MSKLSAGLMNKSKINPGLGNTVVLQSWQMKCVTGRCGSLSTFHLPKSLLQIRTYCCNSASISPKSSGRQKHPRSSVVQMPLSESQLSSKKRFCLIANTTGRLPACLGFPLHSPRGTSYRSLEVEESPFHTHNWRPQ